MSLQNWKSMNSNCRRNILCDRSHPFRATACHSILRRSRHLRNNFWLTEWALSSETTVPLPIFTQTPPPSLIFFAIGLIPPPKGWCREEKIRSFVPPCVFSAVQGAPKALNDNYLSPLQFAQLCHVHACARYINCPHLNLLPLLQPGNCPATVQPICQFSF